MPPPLLLYAGLLEAYFSSSSLARELATALVEGADKSLLLLSSSPLRFDFALSTIVFFSPFVKIINLL